MGWNYAYNYFNENTGRVVYAQNLNDPTLDRAYDYDHVGRPTHFTSGSNARQFTGQGGTDTERWSILASEAAFPMSHLIAQ